MDNSKEYFKYKQNMDIMKKYFTLLIRNIYNGHSKIENLDDFKIDEKVKIFKSD